MYTKLSSTAVEAFRSTLQVIEEQCGLAPDDPSLLELKRILLNRIAELEVVEAASQQSGSQATGATPEAAVIPEPSRSFGDASAMTRIDLPMSLFSDCTTGQDSGGKSVALSGVQELPPVASEMETAFETFPKRTIPTDNSAD